MNFKQNTSRCIDLLIFHQNKSTTAQRDVHKTGIPIIGGIHCTGKMSSKQNILIESKRFFLFKLKMAQVQIVTGYNCLFTVAGIR